MAKEPSAAQRKLFAKMGYAMPDGSYYIRPLPVGEGDLENAIMAVGRGENAGDSGDAIRKHIMKRAAFLKMSSKIPDTWNSDGSLKEAAQSSMTLVDFFEHHGVKGHVVHGITGVSDLIPEGPGPDNSPPEIPQLSDHGRLISAAQDHESIAASHLASAAKRTQDVTDLQQNGLNSPAAKRAFGKDVASQTDGAFVIKNGKTKSAAVAALSSKLNQARGNHIQLAAHHTNMAQKLRTKASKMEHDGLNFDPNFDIDVYLSHFGIKGMHWGVRKERGEPSEDHVRVSELRTKVKTGRGVHVLSNNELQDVNTRLNLETNYSRLTEGGNTSAGEKFVDSLVGVGGSVAKQQASSYANKYAAKGIDHLITKAAKASANK